MTSNTYGAQKLAAAILALAFIISIVPAVVLASDAAGPGAVEVGAPQTTSYNPTPDPTLGVEGGAALGNLGAVPFVWAAALLAILGAVTWGVYRYSNSLP